MDDNQTQDQQLKKDIVISDDVRAYIGSILMDAGLAQDDPDLHEEMVREVFVRLDNYLSTVILNHLPKDKIEPYVKMMEEGKPKTEIEQYMKDNIANVDETFKNAFIDFRSLFLGKIAVARNVPPRTETVDDQLPPAPVAPNTN